MVHVFVLPHIAGRQAACLIDFSLPVDDESLAVCFFYFVDKEDDTAGKSDSQNDAVPG